MKGKALRRALESDPLRVGADVPLIVDTTEIITPTIAHELLQHNTTNRPIDWKAVERYADAMAAGKWELHAQGIVLDGQGNILTGQQRLWAVIYSNTNVYMRVSRGNPASAARLLDRGRPQSSRDLAARDTGRKHTPTEASIARAISVLQGNVRPSTDALAAIITTQAKPMSQLLGAATGTKKTRAVIMIAGAVLFFADGDLNTVRELASHLSLWANQLEAALAPQTPQQCWGKGAAFGLAMEAARKIVWARE